MAVLFEMRPVHIYALTDPSNGKIRYIGATANVRNRFRGHLLEAFKDNPTNKNIWVRELLRNGNIPGLITLEIVDESIWQDKEREWISKFDDLTNEVSGGLGLTSEEQKRYSGDKHPLSAESRKQISDSLKEYFNGNNEAKSKLGKYTRTEWHIERLREQHAKVTKEQVVEIRDLYRTKKYTQQGIADIYHVSQTLVGAIVNYKLWKDVV